MFIGISASAQTGNVYIPDPNFKSRLLANRDINTTYDTEITYAEAQAYTKSIYMRGRGIKSLRGIEAFTSLTELWCNGNELTTLDVSKNTKLTLLRCSDNQLTTLDVSKNTKLTLLSCFKNQLTTLNVSKNTKLTLLYCSRNQLTTLDVSKNTNLRDISCYRNKLTSIDVSKNTNLDDLTCYENQLTTLDVSKNTKLTLLYCFKNQLTKLDVSNNNLRSLYCNDNKLTTLDVTKNTRLFNFRCHNNYLTTLDVSKNKKLKRLDCDANQLKNINLKNGNNTILEAFSAKKNPQLTCLQVDDSRRFRLLWRTKVDNINVIHDNCIGWVKNITIEGEGGATTITTLGGTLQMKKTILPSSADNKKVSWSLDNYTLASISSSGLLTAKANGTVKVTASASDGSGVKGTANIVITNQIGVKSISIAGKGGATTITTKGGTLQMIIKTILPANADIKTVTWSVDNTTLASISSSGLLTAKANGTVKVIATANDVSGVKGIANIVISNQVHVKSISIAGTSGATTITTKGGTLKMVVKNIQPTNADNKTVKWSVDNTTLASISSSGLLTAKANGRVKVIATANDGSGVKGTANIIISNQVHVKSIAIAGIGGATTITAQGGTLQMIIKTILPANADIKTVTWSVDNTTLASISATGGLLTAKANGTVKVTATANDGSSVSGSANIVISNQVVRVKSITIAAKGGAWAAIITTKGGTLKMVIKDIQPTNADNKSVTWSVDNPTLASISSSGLLTAKANGTVKVIATAKDGSGAKGTANIVISNQDQVTSIVSSDLSDELSIYPNPMQDRFSIETNLIIQQIIITDLAGKVLKTIDGNRQSIDVSTLSPNIYFLMLSTEKGIIYRKFMKE